MIHNESQVFLSESIERRIKHLMIQTLNKFENNFTNLKDDHNGILYRNDIKNSFNDVIRATRDEIRDYEIEYRPMKLRENNILSLTKTFFETVKKIEFTSKPGIKIYSVNESDKLEF